MLKGKILKICGFILLVITGAFLFFMAGCGGGGIWSAGQDETPNIEVVATVGGRVLVPVRQSVPPRHEKTPEIHEDVVFKKPADILSDASKTPGADFSGFVPLLNTRVRLGGKVTNTDSNGFFRFDIYRSEESTYITGRPQTIEIESGVSGIIRTTLTIRKGATVVLQIKIDTRAEDPVTVVESTINSLPAGSSPSEIEELLESRISSQEAGQAGTGIITGYVNIPSPVFTLNSTVLPTGASDNQPYVLISTETNENNLYTFTIFNVPVGEISLRLEKPGYTTESKNVRVYAGLATTNVNFNLVSLSTIADLKIEIVSGNNQIGVAGQELSSPLVVKVIGSNGAGVSGVTVTFSIASGGGEIDTSAGVTGIQTTAITGSDGMARCDRWTLGILTGSQTVTASIPGGNPSSVTFTATSVTGTASVISKDTTAGTGDGTQTVGTTRTLTVLVTDSYGNPVAGTAVQFRITSSLSFGSAASEASLASLTAVATGQDGKASNILTLSKKAGDNTVEATISGTTAKVTFTVTGTPDVPAAVSMTPSTETVVDAGVRSQVITARVTDQFGNAVQDGTIVTFTVNDPAPANTGTAGAVTASATTVSGIAGATLTTSSVAGDDYTVTGSVSGASGSVTGTTAKITVIPAAPASFTVQAPSTAIAGVPFNITSIIARDASGNVATSYTGAKTLSYSGASNSPNGEAPVYTTAVTFVDGVATTVLVTTLKKVETARLTVTDQTANISGQSGDIVIQHGAPAVIYKVTEPQSPVINGDKLSTQPLLQIRDACGNLCTSDNSTEVVAARGDGNNWTLGGTTKVRAASGTVVYTDLTAASEAPINGAYLTFTATGLTGAQSGEFSIPAPAIALVADTTANNVDSDIELIFTDNPSWRTAITAVKIGGTALTANTDYTISAGKITLKPSGGNSLLRTAGNKSVTVVATGYPDSSVNQVINPGAAAYLKVTGTANMTAGQTNELTITAYDQYGNVATGYTGTKYLVFSGPGNSPRGDIPKVEGVDIGQPTEVMFTSGISNAGAATLVAYKMEWTTVDVTDGTINSYGDPSYDLNLTVNNATLDHFEVTPANNPAIINNPITLIAKAQDLYNNIITNYGCPGILCLDDATGEITWGGEGVTKNQYGTWVFDGSGFVDGVATFTVTNTVAEGPLTAHVIDYATGKQGTADLTWVNP